MPGSPRGISQARASPPAEGPVLPTPLPSSGLAPQRPAAAHTRFSTVSCGWWCLPGRRALPSPVRSQIPQRRGDGFRFLCQQEGPAPVLGTEPGFGESWLVA